MTELAAAFDAPVWIAFGVTMFFAGVAQGAVGFGFPAISTPVLVQFTDIKTAILINLLPNFTANVISVLRGGNWRASIGRYWPLTLYVVAGSFLGASFLMVAPPEPVRLLLAAMTFAYLYQRHLARLDWSWLTRRPRIAQGVFGLTAGFCSGSVSNSLPPLLIYFMQLGVEITIMTQVVNLCFLTGRTTQAATLAAAGQIDVSIALANVPLTLIAVAGIYAGFAIQRRVDAATYQAVLRKVLFALALLLLWQGLRPLFG